MDDPCLSVEEECGAHTADGESCLMDAKYGRLCSRHARQVAYAPMGSGRRKVVRVHLSALTEQEVAEAEAAYLEDKGYRSPSSSNPYAYVHEIMDYVRERGEVPSSEVTAHIQSISPYSITAGKTGQVLRLLTMRGALRRRTGKHGSIYTVGDRTDL